MERNRVSWYCKKGFQRIAQSQAIVLKYLSKSYQSKGKAKTALSDVTLNIPQGEMFCIMGSSGSGMYACKQQNQLSASHNDFWSDIAIRCSPIWLLPGGNKDIGQTILKLGEDRILWIFQKNY